MEKQQEHHDQITNSSNESNYIIRLISNWVFMTGLFSSHWNATKPKKMHKT